MEWTKKEPPALLHYPVAMRGALPSDSSFVICIEGQGMHEMLQSAPPRSIGKGGALGRESTG